MKKNYYEVLEISYTATQAEIKESYRKLVKKYHPDVNLNKDTTKEFQIISEAYTVLSNPVKRKNYDLSINNSYKQKSNTYSQQHYSSYSNNNSKTNKDYKNIVFKYNYSDLIIYYELFIDLSFKPEIWLKKYLQTQKMILNITNNNQMKEIILKDIKLTIKKYQKIIEIRNREFNNYSKANSQKSKTSYKSPKNDTKDKYSNIAFKYNYTDFTNFAYLFMDLEFNPNIWYEEYMKRQKSPFEKDPDMWKTMDYYDEMNVQRKKKQEKQTVKRYYKK